MDFIGLALGVLLIAFALWTWPRLRTRKSDLEAIERLASSRNFAVESVKRDYDWWRYWPHATYELGSLARIFVVTAVSPDGRRRELRLAIARVGASDAMKIVDERDA